MTNQQVGRPARAGPGFFYGYIIVIICFLLMVSMIGTYNSFGVFFNSLLAEFGWTRAMTSLAFSLSWVTQGIAAIVVGRVTDKLGPRVVVTVCGLLLGVGYVLMSRVNAIWQIDLFYGIIGVGMAGSYVPLMSTVARWFSRKRNTMIGIVVTGTGVGTIIGPTLASWFISIYDWRTSFVIMGVAVGLVAVIASQFMRYDPAGMGLSPYGGEGENEAGQQPRGKGFTLREAVSTRQFWLLFFMSFGSGFCIFVTMVHVVPNATGLGVPAATAAGLIATVGGVGIAGRLVLGSAADKIGNRKVLLIGFSLVCVAFLWLAQARAEWALFVFAIIYGFGYGGCEAQWPATTATLFGLSSLALILATNAIGFSIGAAIGPVLTGYIYDISGSYQAAFLIAAFVAAVAFTLALFLTPTRAK